MSIDNPDTDKVYIQEKDPLVQKSEEYFLTDTLAQRGIIDRFELLELCEQINTQHGISINIDNFIDLARDKFDQLLQKGQIAAEQIPSLISTDDALSSVEQIDIDRLVHKKKIAKSWPK